MLRYSPLCLLFCIYICAAQPSRFCSRLTRECTTDCRENGTASIDCVVDCTCLDPQIEPLLSYEECTNRFDRIIETCRGRNCGLSRYLNDFCSSLPGRCCDPNELDFVECADNSTEPICCDGEWQCSNGLSGCSQRLLSSACCCDSSVRRLCPGFGAAECCPNDGQWQCPDNFLSTRYTCSDGNIYTRNEMADECCCDPYEEPGRFGNSLCSDGYICCPDGTWSCGIGDGLYSCNGQLASGSEINQGERCTCAEEDDPFQLCIFVTVCCDGQVYSTPCAAEAACYDPYDEEFCSFQYQFVGNGCVPTNQGGGGRGGKGKGRGE